MAILVKTEINQRIDAGLLTSADKNKTQGCSYDMRVGTIFRGDKKIKPGPGDDFVSIQPGEFVIIHTLEQVALPPSIAATAFAINGQSSHGLLVLNPGHVDPGYNGPLTVNAINLTKQPITIRLGQPIFTIIFDDLGKDTEPYGSNRPLAELEKRLSEYEQTKASRNVADLIIANTDAKFIDEDELAASIRQVKLDRYNWVLFVFGVAGAIVSVIGIIVSAAALLAAIATMCAAVWPAPVPAPVVVPATQSSTNAPAQVPQGRPQNVGGDASDVRNDPVRPPEPQNNEAPADEVNSGASSEK